MNKKKSILESNVLYTIVAIIAGFLVGAIFLLIAGISPAVAYGKLFDSIFSKPKYLVWTLVYASPLIFTGLSVAFSFRTGVFNIGAEGQFVIGSLVACVLGIVLKLPPVLHALVCLVAAAAAGCIWSLIVGVLKVLLLQNDRQDAAQDLGQFLVSLLPGQHIGPGEIVHGFGVFVGDGIEQPPRGGLHRASRPPAHTFPVAHPVPLLVLNDPPLQVGLALPAAVQDHPGGPDLFRPDLHCLLH